MRGKPTQPILSLLFLFILSFLSARMHMAEAHSSAMVEVEVGVILDMDTAVSKMWHECISMALSDFYSSRPHYKTRLFLNVRDSKDTVVGAAAAALDLLKNVQVQAIIGPVTSTQANFVINLGNEAQVPIISFSATTPSLSSLRSEYFIRTALNDSSQVKAITAIIQAFGWRQVVPIYMDNEYGEGLMSFLADSLQEIDTRVPYTSIIHPLASDTEIVAELRKLMAMQCRVFIVHMYTSLSARLFTEAEEVGMMSEGYVWIITDGLTSSLNSMHPKVIDSMQGVLGVKPHVPRTKRYEDFVSRWEKKSHQEKYSNLDIFGLWAYDAATALAMAVEKVGAEANFTFQRTSLSRNSSELESFGVSLMGKDLSQALSSTQFRGLSGNFHIVNNQLQSSAFQIVNLIGNRERGVGFWTPENGLVRELAADDGNPTLSKENNLKVIMWPGDVTNTPKGWVMPTNGKVLRIGVPVKDGTSNFVNGTEGYCIDVFDATVLELPYALRYEYIPFAKADGTSAGSIDDLLQKVFQGDLDAVVGDVTIVAHRSKYVDFTLQYYESGVTMIVPFKDKKYKNAWVFLKPLTWDLWVTSACFFVFIGFVIWILEHQINEDFGGPRLQQVGNSFWFSFSTIVFAHREKVVSNLAKFVVIIWCFVVLILTQSYTASLTSLLTVQQLEPSIADMEELIIKRKNVGYPKGSFVLEHLKRKKFHDSQLKMYKSMEDLHVAFANGSIDAAFDETPYLKLFIAKHCSKYTMVPPTHKNGGFGFAFPKGSPLVADVSRAILNVAEGDKMERIENAWHAQNNCPESSKTASSSSLSFGSFWGLFLIVGVASSFALIIFVAMLLYEHRNFFMHLDLKALIFMWNNICKNDEGNGRDSTHQEQEASVSMATSIAASPATQCPPVSRLSVSDDETNCVLFEAREILSAQYRYPSGQRSLEIVQIDRREN